MSGVVHRLGVGIEGDGDRDLAAIARVGDHALEDRLVTAVNAVEVPDRHDRGAKIARHIRE